jgi:hypothetical protein
MGTPPTTPTLWLSASVSNQDRMTWPLTMPKHYGLDGDDTMVKFPCFPGQNGVQMRSRYRLINGR